MPEPQQIYTNVHVRMAFGVCMIAADVFKAARESEDGGQQAFKQQLLNDVAFRDMLADQLRDAAQDIQSEAGLGWLNEAVVAPGLDDNEALYCSSCGEGDHYIDSKFCRCCGTKFGE